MSTPDLITVLGDAQRARRHTTNKGRTFEPDPIDAAEVAQLLAVCRPLVAGRVGWLSALRLTAQIVVLYRTGIRISELLALEENDLDPVEQSLVIKRGKGGKRRVVLMDEWGWRELQPWLTARRELPTGALFCVVRGRSAGKPVESCDVRRSLREARDRAGLRRRINPHSFRHGFSVEFHHETKDLIALQRQLGHSSPTVTGVYLRGIDTLEALQPIARRSAPTVVIPSSPASLDPHTAPFGTP